MNTLKGTTVHKRVNITLPENTIQLLDRITAKGSRSAFVEQAVRFYIKEVGSANLKKQLRAGSIARAARDTTTAEEWFALD
ncbi:MAG: ribbon-helix-helix domain-containing protein [bacterium]|nr:ribbon-helix-helix domain-containing protein [bacterium]